MMQPFADALTWMPKSRTMAATLTRAHDLARARGHDAVTLEHVLLALTEDPDAVSVLAACTVDVARLGDVAAAHVAALPPGDQSMPGADPALLRILQYAVAAARQSRRGEVSGAIVLAAIVGEGESEAAQILQRSGLTFQETVRALQQVGPARPAAPVASNALQPVDDLPPANAEAVPPSQPAPTAPPAPIASGADTAADASAAGHAPPTTGHQADIDPVTTARQRIAAQRAGNASSAKSAHPIQQPSSPSPLATAHVNPPPAAIAEPPHQDAPQSSPAQDWMPPALPRQPLSDRLAKPARMPPPVPPVLGSPRAGYDAAVKLPPGADAAALGASGYRHPNNLIPGAMASPGAGPLSVNGAAMPAVAGTNFEPPWEDRSTRSDGPLHGASPSPSSHGHAADRVEPFDIARFAESIPRRLRSGSPQTVELRIQRAAVAGIAIMPAGQQVVAGRDHALGRALTVRLKSPSRTVMIESVSPETHWFGVRTGSTEDDTVRWRWIVTPRRRGRDELRLGLALRAIGPDGIAIEQPLPERAIEVSISPDYRRATLTLAAWLAAALGGATATVLVSGLLPATLTALQRALGL